MPHIELFDPAQCQPMAPPRALTHAPCAVLIARDELSQGGLCRPCAAGELAAEIAERDGQRVAALRGLLSRGASPRKAIYLGTETTGLDGGHDELLEMPAIDDAGLVFESQVRPFRHMTWLEAADPLDSSVRRAKRPYFGRPLTETGTGVAFGRGRGDLQRPVRPGFPAS